jgi:hypothetical protein
LLTAAVASGLLAATLAGCEMPEDSSDTAQTTKKAKHRNSPKLDQDAKLAIVDQYIEATQMQEEVLRGAQMEVDIEAKLPALAKHGTLRALRKISMLGKITYKALGFSGDNTVKQEVISRYLTAESEARDLGTIAITPANYKFRYSGRLLQGSQNLQILEVTPRKKAIGLFKGELWIDSKTGMPVRESGEFVKTPSVFLKKIAFVRYYELRDGISFPSRIESTVDTRIVGRAELEIYFRNFEKPAVADDQDAVAEPKSIGTAQPGTAHPATVQSGNSE